MRYNPYAEDPADVFTGLTIDIARLLEIELDCQFKFVLGDPSNPNAQAGAVSAVLSNALQASAINPEMLASNVTHADVAGGAIHATATATTNLSGIHYTLPFFDSGYQLFTRAPLKSPSIWSFFEPFRLSLWVAVIIEVLVVACAFYLMEAPGVRFA